MEWVTVRVLNGKDVIIVNANCPTGSPNVPRR